MKTLFRRKRKTFLAVLSFFLVLTFIVPMIPPIYTQAEASAFVPTDALGYCEQMRYLMETYVDPEYFRGNAQSIGVNAEQYEELKQVALDVTSDCDTQYEKIRAITLYVADRIYYDYYYYNGLADWTYTNAYDVYRERRTVCEGYANLVRAFCVTLGIPCMEITGMNHAYNGAYDSENKRWVLTDATWCSRNKYTTNQEWEKQKADLDWFDITMETLKTYGTGNHEIFDLRGILYNSVYYRIYNRSGSLENARYRDYENWLIQPVDAAGEIIKIPSEIEGIRVFMDSFEYESNVKVLDLSESKITSLYRYGLTECTSLEKIIFPDTLESIDQAVFDNCTSLKEVDLSNTKIERVPSECFQNCTNLEKVVLSKNVTAIGDNAFVGCSNLREIDLSTTSIAEFSRDIFEGCTKLEKIKFPSSLKKIDPYSFRECDLVKEFDFSNTQIETIPNYCFQNLESLETIRFPETLTTLGFRAFYNCKNIEELDFSNTKITEIPASYFETYGKLKKVLLPSTLETIGEDAFGRCESLEEILLAHTKVTQIPSGAFGLCTALKKVTFPSTLESIGNSAFCNTNITELDFYHTQLKTVERYAFFGCEKLVSIKFPSTIETLGDFSFYRSNSKDMYVYLPKDSDFDQSTYMKTYGAWPSGKRIVMRLDKNGNVIQESAPKNPSSVKAILYGHDDVKVSWSKVSGASGYQVYYKKSTAKSWSSKSTTSTSMKLANLSDGVKYDIKVVAYKKVNDNKLYSVGKATSIYTLKKITGVKVKKSGSKVKVSWSNISGESGYQISKSTKKNKTSIVSTYKTTSGKSKTISATKKKTYYYKVRAYTVVDGKKIYSPWSTAVKYIRK